MSDSPELLRQYTPADLARRLAQEGTIMNVATAWAFLRGRVAEDFPGRASVDEPVVISLAPAEFDELVEELLLHIDSFRYRLSSSLAEAERQGGQIRHSS